MGALSLNIPKRENPWAGDVYNELTREFPLNIIRDKDTHAQAKELFLMLLRYKAANSEKTDRTNKIAQINAYMGSLKLLILDYENERFHSRPVSAVEILKDLMTRHELKQKDLENEIGAQAHVSRILSGDRELTLTQIKALSKRFNLKPSAFLQK